MTYSGAYGEKVAHERPTCRGRHWFTVYGAVGLRRPDCARCGVPNPRFTAMQRREWDEWEADDRPIGPDSDAQCC